MTRCRADTSAEIPLPPGEGGRRPGEGRVINASAAHGAVSWDPPPSHSCAVKISVAFVPPKPNEFDMACSSFISRFTLGT